MPPENLSPAAPPFARKPSRLHQTDYLALGAVAFTAGFAAATLRHYQARKAAMRSAARWIAGSEVGQGSSHDRLMGAVEKRLREELAKLQVEINEVWRDKSASSPATIGGVALSMT